MASSWRQSNTSFDFSASPNNSKVMAPSSAPTEIVVPLMCRTPVKFTSNIKDNIVKKTLVREVSVKVSKFRTFISCGKEIVMVSNPSKLQVRKDLANECYVVKINAKQFTFDTTEDRWNTFIRKVEAAYDRLKPKAKRSSVKETPVLTTSPRKVVSFSTGKKASKKSVLTSGFTPVDTLSAKKNSISEKKASSTEFLSPFRGSRTTSRSSPKTHSARKLTFSPPRSGNRSSKRYMSPTRDESVTPKKQHDTTTTTTAAHSSSSPALRVLDIAPPLNFHVNAGNTKTTSLKKKRLKRSNQDDSEDDEFDFSAKTETSDLSNNSAEVVASPVDKENVKHDFNSIALRGPGGKNHRYKGIKNLGNSCYLSANIQALVSLNHFMTMIQNEAWLVAIWKELGIKEEVPNTLSSSETSVEDTHVYQKILTSARDVAKQEEIVNITDLKRILGQRNTCFAGYGQQDAHELLMGLLDQLADDMSLHLLNRLKSVASEESQVKQLMEKSVPCLPIESEFTSEVARVLECESCGYTRESTETYRVFSLNLPESKPSPNCSCNAPAASFISKKENENKGKQFYTCAKKICNYFKWEGDEAAAANAPLCTKCNTPSSRFVSKKDNENKGREFFKCQKEGCNFFKWGTGGKSNENNNDSGAGKLVSVPDSSSALSLPLLFQNLFKSHNVDITCEKCDNGKVALAKYEVRHLPNVVILHLKRFQMNMYGTYSEKRRDEVRIPTTLDANTLMCLDTPTSSTKNPKTYQLRSVIHHKGSQAGSGHYVTDVFNSKENSWTRFDDSLVMELNDGDALSSSWNRTAYILFYQVADK